MNKKDILEIISNLFSNYSFHPRCISEFTELLKKDLRGKEARFFKLMTTQFNNIMTFGKMIHTVDGHEQIKGASRTYFSIHLQQNQYNIRLLIYFTETNTPLFLCIFNERAGKSVSDYTQYVKVLDARLNEMLGDDIDE